MKKKILKIMTKWSEGIYDFEGRWLGYNQLREELRNQNIFVSHDDLKKCMKELKLEGKVELLPLYDSEYKLYGRGWFKKEQDKEKEE